MNYELLTINSPDLLAELADRFRARNCPDCQEAVAWLPADASSGVVLAAVPSESLHVLAQAALTRPNLPFFWLTDDLAAANACGAEKIPNITILPAGMGAAHLGPMIAKTLRDQELRRENRELIEGTASGSVSTLFEVLSITDPYSASLGQRLRYAADLFCKSARLELTWDLETAALLAEIGVLTIPARVITKSQSGQELSGFEKDLISHIPERGADLLHQIPSFRNVSKILRYQGKNFDGSGLPNDSVAGERLPLGARILKVLNDLFRLKDGGKAQEEAISDMENGGRRYDPELLEIAAHCFEVNVPANIAGNTRPLTVRDLRPGQLLVSNVLTEDGVLLIRDGQVISARLLHKLRNFAFTSGIKEPIYVIDLLKSREMTTTFQDLAQSETAFFPKP